MGLFGLDLNGVLRRFVWVGLVKRVVFVCGEDEREEICGGERWKI